MAMKRFSIAVFLCIIVELISLGTGCSTGSFWHEANQALRMSEDIDQSTAMSSIFYPPDSTDLVPRYMEITAEQTEVQQEKAAGEKVQNAKAEADKIRKASEQQIRQIKIDAENSAKQTESDRLKATDEEGSKAAETARTEALKKAEALKQTAAGNEEAAIKAVIDAVISK